MIPTPLPRSRVQRAVLADAALQRHLDESTFGNIRSLAKYKEARWDWAPLNDCFGNTGIRIGDVDGIVERRGRFLFLEGKLNDDPTRVPDGRLPVGQQRLHDALARTGVFTVLVAWGLPYQRIVNFIRTQNKEGVGDVVRTDLDGMKAVVRGWFDAANSMDGGRP